MPSRSFGDIASGVADFLDAEEYSFGRNIKVNVRTDVDVNWSVDTTISDGNRLNDTDFELAHKLGKEKISVTTKTYDNPKFSLKTSRIKGVNASFSLEEPKIKLGANVVRDKFALQTKFTYKYATGSQPAAKAASWSADLNVAYEQGEQITVGAELKVDNITTQPKLKDYNVRAEFRRNEDQTFSFRTENSLQLLQFGAVAALPRGFTGYLEGGVERLEMKNEENNGDGQGQKSSLPVYAAGVSYPFDAQNEVRAMFRSDRTATLAYSTRSSSAFAAYFAYNAAFKDTRTGSLEYKLVFG